VHRGEALWVAATPMAEAARLEAGPGPAFVDAGRAQAAMTRAAWFVVAAADGGPRVLLVTEGDDAVAAGEWLDAGWQPVGLAETLSGLGTVELEAVSGPGLPAELASKMATIQRQVGVLRDLGNDPELALAEGQRLLPAAVSTSWGGDWDLALEWLGWAADDLNVKVGSGGVELHVAAEWYLSSTDNRMPISVENNTGIPVTVQVGFASENPGRLSVPITAPVTIDPGATGSVVAMPQAHGNGSVSVKVQLFSLSGTTVGSPVTVQVVTTSAGRLGWMIIVGSGLAFVVATSLRVRQVRRSRKTGDEGASEQAKDSAAVSAVAEPDGDAE